MKRHVLHKDSQLTDKDALFKILSESGTNEKLLECVKGIFKLADLPTDLVFNFVDNDVVAAAAAAPGESEGDGSSVRVAMQKEVEML